MSSEYEYRQLVFHFDATPAFERFKQIDPKIYPGFDTRFTIVFGEHGASNCTQFINGKEVLKRYWSLLTLGTNRVLRDFIAWSVDAEGGMLRRNGKYMRAENYIAAWRKNIAKPLPINVLLHWMSGQAITIDTVRLHQVERRNKHPWYVVKLQRNEIVESSDRVQIVLSAHRDELDLLCDLVMLDDLCQYDAHSYPFGSIISRHNSLFGDIHARNSGLGVAA